MQIAVVGCGWLGLPLAINLQENGHQIVATCRDDEKAYELTKLGFNSEKFELGDDLIHGRLTKLFTARVLVLNIPVGRKNPKTEHFVKHMQALLKHAANSKIQNVIFISTTSVYGDNDAIVTEQSLTHAQTQSGKINLAVELLVNEYFVGCSTIIRPAGLVGKNRHPANYLAGKTDLLNPDNVVNLVHQDDVVCAIKTVIDRGLWGHKLHLSALEHPTRAQYYTWAAEKLGLNPPNFVKSKGVVLGKKIDATRSLQVLGLSLKYPSPFDMLRQ
ncbi:MAG: nucleoside-diphosphate-sugar epimerase [Paraglaciecola sp.]|jgi:nucleoside-diphosphate-sugar epimerase